LLRHQLAHIRRRSRNVRLEGRNPSDRRIIKIKASKRVAFAASRDLKAAL
jgi:nucleoid DNA-binding protein